MKSDEEKVALQGIEFWSNVCEAEIDLEAEAAQVYAGTVCYSSDCAHAFSSVPTLPFLSPLLAIMLFHPPITHTHTHTH